MNRKKLKDKAKVLLDKHYLIYIFVCLISVFVGAEFLGSLTISKLNFNAELLKGTNGVFAYLMNAATSDGISTTILKFIVSIVGSKNIANGIMIIASFIFSMFIWAFIRNTYIIIARRVFLEGRTYKHLSLRSFTFLITTKKWFKASFTLALTYIYYILWCFTIVGIFTKYYSYKMVPFILAENPDIKPNDAIKLSSNMMYGHRWECCKLGISFIGWELLGAISFGFTRLVFSNAYRIGTYSEYYYELRKEAKSKDIYNADLLNDTYLYKKADKELLNQKYEDILELIDEKNVRKPRLHKFKKLLNWLGIKVYDTKYELEYEKEQIKEMKKREYIKILNREQYPSRLSPLPTSDKRSMIEHINYMRHYSISSLILLFFIFAFGGWIWEVSLHLITDGEFVNRGVLHGPWLPIYGTGAVLILVFLNKFRDRPWLEFLMIILVCGIVEYFTSYYLEMVHGKRWWDYSGYVLNLNGRICAEGLLVFGIGGMVGVYVLAPLIDNFLRRQDSDILLMICVTLLSFFILDKVYSSKYPNEGTGITDYMAIKEVDV